MMNNEAFKNLGVVYSTEHGKMCPACGKPVAGCICHQSQQSAKGKGVVRVGRETKGRKGSGVTVITGIPMHPEGLQKLAKELKQECGAGGTIKDGVIEIQGEHRDMLLELLQKRGYTVKRAGG